MHRDADGFRRVDGGGLGRAGNRYGDCAESKYNRQDETATHGRHKTWTKPSETWTKLAAHLSSDRRAFSGGGENIFPRGKTAAQFATAACFESRSVPQGACRLSWRENPMRSRTARPRLPAARPPSPIPWAGDSGRKSNRHAPPWRAGRSQGPGRIQSHPPRPRMA